MFVRCSRCSLPSASQSASTGSCFLDMAAVLLATWYSIFPQKGLKLEKLLSCEWWLISTRWLPPNVISQQNAIYVFSDLAWSIAAMRAIQLIKRCCSHSWSWPLRTLVLMETWWYVHIISYRSFFFPHHLTMCHLLFFHQALGVPCKSQQVTKYASYSKDTVDLLFRVLHGMPVAPVGIEHTHIKLALDEKLLQQDQERLGIEVAARLISISTYLANLLAPI